MSLFEDIVRTRKHAAWGLANYFLIELQNLGFGHVPPLERYLLAERWAVFYKPLDHRVADPWL